MPRPTQDFSELTEAVRGLQLDHDQVERIAGGFCELAHYLYENHLGRALREIFASDEHSLNSQPANVVDGLFAIAGAIERLARAVEEAGQK